MLTSAGCFHSCVQGQKVGLTCDFLNNGNLLSNRAHGGNCLVDSVTGGFSIPRRLTGDLFGLGSVISVLLDVGCHFLHRGGCFFGRRGLLGGTLAELFGT